jgi:hypothetical protein
VTVSWRSRDDDGQPLPPSPLVERLPGPPAAEAPAAPPLYAPPSSTAGGGPAPRAGELPRPAREEAILASLAGAPRSAVEPLLAVAVAEARRDLEAPLLPLEARDVAAACRSVLDEMDPDAGRAHRLGPYFGFLGAVRAAADDPRRADPWVTHLENLAACPWQLFLRRVLRVEPTPDPLSALPGLDALLLGNVVHRVLEGLAAQAGAAVHEPLEDLAGSSAAAVPWPPESELDGLLRRTAFEVLADEGMPLPGLARALARRARPYLDRAREEDWAPRGGPLRVLAAEALGAVRVRDAAGRDRRLRFRADRADGATDAAQEGEGGYRLTDYKTGRPLSDAKRDATRREHHLREVGRGTKLQATAYALAAAYASGHGAGRYLYLKPDARHAEFAVDAGDAAFAAAFSDAVATALAAWDAGAFFPRLEHADREQEPSRCQWCEVSEACLRLDSGARLRLRRWVREGDGGGEASAAEAALRDLWLLDSGRGGDGGRRGGGG